MQTTVSGVRDLRNDKGNPDNMKRKWKIKKCNCSCEPLNYFSRALHSLLSFVRRGAACWAWFIHRKFQLTETETHESLIASPESPVLLASIVMDELPENLG